MNIQLSILLYLQSIRGPVLSAIANAASFLGELPLPLLITLFIYWCLSKKKGIALLLTELSAISAMQVLKCIFRIPRPFMKYPELIKPLREGSATGYSFPSGHSVTAASSYGTLIHLFKNRVIAILSAIAIILTPLSRLYLGVHWPSDVFFGTFLGLLSALVLPPLFIRLYEREKALAIFASVFSPAAFAVALTAAILLGRGSDPRLLKDLMDTLALGSSAVFGIMLDRKYLDFRPADRWCVRISALIIGLALGGAGVLALRSIFPLYIGKLLGYLFFGLWATFIYPAIGKKLRMFC